MKCDKLQQVENPIEWGLYYDKNEVDAAIAELKRENERLVKCCKEYDSRQRIDERIKFNGSQQLRATKRALWLARAELAKETQFLWNVYCHCDKLYFCKPFCVSTRKNPYRYISRMNVVEWDEFWGKIKNKCLAKAEAYK